NDPDMNHIQLDHLSIKDVYYENPGFIRDAREVHSANGTQSYGWGIRVVNKMPAHLIRNIQIQNCEISDVSHTGIKLIGSKKNVKDVKILDNRVSYTGGPGIQMSEVQDVYVANNVVDHSGSNNDSRKWGRGSGLWTWGSKDVLIEKNKFLHANGPGDSDGAHIDFNCENIIIQYNFSAYNAGGFCEILGNNYNAVYRYNISVNDGHRIKGKDGAFQEGKILWLSGYQGDKQKRKGPVNTYIYNNTIYTDASLYPKIAFDNTSKGVVIANNIFYLVNPFQVVQGDQYKPDVSATAGVDNMELNQNLFLHSNSWPEEMTVKGAVSLFGDPDFTKPGGLQIQDYRPLNTTLIKQKGSKTADWNIGDAKPAVSLKMDKDILGNPVSDHPSIGAIEPAAYSN
ncbi:MAG: right-handed parallel beta-helix repeat-containing protein, partial [Bacteroidota bacterium]|nr:right-handed parallel beta-helix repeat-containing protein [Bacteroidota bacterium]